jgi:hypothetical protein
MPAPTNGINAADGFMSMAPNDAVWMSNIVPGEYGCRVRKGYSEWANLAIGGLNDIRSIMPFVDQDGITTKKFIATDQGIYDVSTSGIAPTKVVTFSTTGSDAGWCSYLQMTSIGGTHYLLVADEANGYFTYDTSGGWVTNPSVTGLPGSMTSNHIRFIASFKDRLWFALEGTSDVYYLGLAAITGAAVKFGVGAKTAHGGYTVGMWNYTRDGGDGIDDFLTIMTRGGDLLVYQGYDPASSSSIELVGQWYVGDVPEGRRLVSEFGGDLLLLTTFGVFSLSKLLSGGLISDPDFYLTYKVARLVRDVMSTNSGSRGWEVKIHNREAVLILGMPRVNSRPYRQYVMNLNTGAWGMWKDIPALCFETHNNEMYFGTSLLDGADNASLYYMTGSTDAVTLAGASAGLVEFTLLPAFSHFGLPGKWKRVHFIRPVFTSELPPSYIAIPQYDFHSSELELSVGLPGTVTGSIWDTDLWDAAEWWTGYLQPIESIGGGVDMGRNVSYVLKGSSASDTTYIGADIMADAGGLL